eukprot:4240459-Ditylum_brightwellii.AAC.1
MNDKKEPLYPGGRVLITTADGRDYECNPVENKKTKLLPEVNQILYASNLPFKIISRVTRGAAFVGYEDIGGR